MRILDGVVEPEAARLFAEMINSYRKHMQQRDRRLRAIRRHLNKGADLRHIRDAKRARCFELGKHQRQRVRPMQRGDGRNRKSRRGAIGPVIDYRS